MRCDNNASFPYERGSLDLGIEYRSSLSPAIMANLFVFLAWLVIGEALLIDHSKSYQLHHSTSVHISMNNNALKLI